MQRGNAPEKGTANLPYKASVRLKVNGRSQWIGENRGLIVKLVKTKLLRQIFSQLNFFNLQATFGGLQSGQNPH
jgi:hypothetical protein